jgi:hypothetical protein
MPIHSSGIVGRLEGADVSSLRACWFDVFGVPAPVHAKRDLLTRCLAYALQEREYGGLSKSVLKELRTDLQDRSDASARSTGEGTRLVRGWGGTTHEVTVLAQGFAYRGTTYRSLSEIARTITGARWSGPRFFGLRASASTSGGDHGHAA